MNSSRRQWLATCLSMAALPDVVAARRHARHAAAQPAAPPRFETLDPQTAAEIEAIAAQIIPSTGGPGAREAGVIFFIDRALSSFAASEVETYRAGMARLQEKRKELFPSSTTIAALAPDQQVALIRTIESSDFFELLRTHTVLGFLGDPSYGGNRDKTGWRQIGFEDRMAWQAPFGYYDAEAAHK